MLVVTRADNMNYLLDNQSGAETQNAKTGHPAYNLDIYISV